MKLKAHQSWNDPAGHPYAAGVFGVFPAGTERRDFTATFLQELVVEEHSLIPHRTHSETLLSATLSKPGGGQVVFNAHRTHDIDYLLILSREEALRRGRGEDERAIRNVLQSYEGALTIRDGQLAAAMVTSNTIRFYERARVVALEASASEVRALPFAERIVVLTFRHIMPLNMLRSSTGSGLFADYISRDPNAGPMGFRFHGAEVDGESAVAIM